MAAKIARSLGTILGIAVLASCASALKYTTPTKTFGKTATVATLSDSSNYRKSIRAWKLSDPQYSSLDDTKIANLVCIPLVMAFSVDASRNRVRSVSKALSETAAKSPTTVVGLFGALMTDSELDKVIDKLLTNANVAPANGAGASTSVQMNATTLNNHCRQSVFFTIHGGAPAAHDNVLKFGNIKVDADLSLQTQWTNIENGSGLTTSLTDLSGLTSAVQGILKGVLTYADQARRERELKEFFKHPAESLLAAFAEIDRTSRANELAGRIKAERSLRESLENYETIAGSQPVISLEDAISSLDELQANAGISDPEREFRNKQFELNDLRRSGGQIKLNGNAQAVEELLEAMELMDVKILGEMSEIVAKPKKFSLSYSVVQKSSTVVDGETVDSFSLAPAAGNYDYVPQSKIGLALFGGFKKLQDRANTDWSKLESKDQIKELEAMFSFLATAAKLQTELSKFENNKSSNVLLNRVIDGID